MSTEPNLDDQVHQVLAELNSVLGEMAGREDLPSDDPLTLPEVDELFVLPTDGPAPADDQEVL